MSESYDYSRGFAERAAVSLANPGLRRSIATATELQTANRLAGLTSLKDPEAMRTLGSQIRASVMSRLDEHLERLAENWIAAGGEVFFAADDKEASSYVCSVATRAGAKTVVKSKSMASEEIALNNALNAAGIEAIETDLGEYIVQQDGGHPSHIVAPAIHKSKEDVAELFSAIAGEKLPVDTVALMKFARGVLRDKFLNAEMGVSGVNFAVADPGAICLVTNEGNGRMCTSLPPVHVAIMGMERLVADWEQLAVMLALLARSGTGQKLTQYTSLLHGPRHSGETDGPEESHLVI
ncbi:MAG: LUD domain-containing protein, partial [Actinomycetota bacterium]|nr:LUD domain-containing protein [Actinomycetota bacterium]